MIEIAFKPEAVRNATRQLNRLKGTQFNDNIAQLRDDEITDVTTTNGMLRLVGVGHSPAPKWEFPLTSIDGVYRLEEQLVPAR